MMLLSKEMTDKDRSLKTQLLIRSDGSDDRVSGERVWKEDDFFGDIKPDLNMEKKTCRRIHCFTLTKGICQLLKTAT